MPTSQLFDAFTSLQEQTWSLIRPTHTSKLSLQNSQRPIFAITSDSLHFLNTFRFNNIDSSNFKKKIMKKNLDSIIKKPILNFETMTLHEVKSLSAKKGLKRFFTIKNFFYYYKMYNFIITFYIVHNYLNYKNYRNKTMHR